MTERGFNAILDTRPEKIWPGIVEKTDFKQVLKFFRLVDDPEMDDAEKFYYMVKLFFVKPPELDPEKLIEAVLDFIACGKREETATGGKGGAVTFDWNADAGRIFAAFWQAYRIDLRKVKMHWWTFNELFQNLPDDCRLMQVMELRGRKPGKHDDAATRKALRDAQAAVAIESARDNTAALDDFFSAYARGR